MKAGLAIIWKGDVGFAEKAKLLLEDYDSTMCDVRRLVRGEGNQLRIISLQPGSNISVIQSERYAACTRK
jgi:hypothetical protein